MKRSILLLAILSLTSFLPAQEKKTVPFVSTPEVSAPAAGSRRVLGLRERRQLGLTVANISVALKELKAEGEIDKTSSDSEIAAAVAAKLAEKNPQSFGAAGIDLDAIIAFIEKLLPLILKLIALFG